MFCSRTILADMTEFGADEETMEAILVFDALMIQGLTYTNNSGEESIKFYVDSIVDGVFSDLYSFVDELEKEHNGMGYNQSYFRQDKRRKVLIGLGQNEYYVHRTMEVVSWFLIIRDVSLDLDSLCLTHTRKESIHLDQSPLKKSLKEDPFVKLFEYGSADGKESYLTYDHIICQVKDLFDVLFVLYGTKYDIQLLFDHSCGHDRMRSDALNVNCMKVTFGGKSA
eukprot:15337284-Ditylum_brightwellii.AAC.1